VICLEEPENGIHPDRIGEMIQLLRDIAVDPNGRIGEDNPLRQVLVNTHSPVVVQNVHPNDLIYIDEERILRHGSAGKVASLRVPAGTWRAHEQSTPHLAPGQIRSYFPEQYEMWDRLVEG
jgi:predicted ATPase